MNRRIGLVVVLLGCWALALYAAAAAEPPRPAGPQEVDPEVLARGKTIYDARCKMCHRSDGKGTMDEMDLTDALWKHGSTAEDIEKVIREGIKETGMRPITGDYSDSDIKALVKYVLAFSAKAPAAPPAPPAAPSSTAPPAPASPAAPPAPPAPPPHER